MTLSDLKDRATAAELCLINTVEDLILSNHKPAADYLTRVQAALRDYAASAGPSAGLGRPDHGRPDLTPYHMDMLRGWFAGLPAVVEKVKLT